MVTLHITSTDHSRGHQPSPSGFRSHVVTHEGSKYILTGSYFQQQLLNRKENMGIHIYIRLWENEVWFVLPYSPSSLLLCERKQSRSVREDKGHQVSQDMHGQGEIWTKNR
jgi:hypothetical protein